MSLKRKGSIPFIRKCVENGVRVTLAHHNGSPGEIKRAVDAGASESNHLGNGCANMIHRHNNPLWPQLAEERLTPSIIADGCHLTDEEGEMLLHKTIVAGEVVYSKD